MREPGCVAAITGLLMAVLVLVAVACGGSGDALPGGNGSPPGAGETGQAAHDPAPGGLAALPAPAEITHHASAAVQSRTGAEFATSALTPQLLETDPDDATRGLFSPAWDSAAPDNGDMAYGLYTFTLEDYSGGFTMEHAWATPPPAGTLWFGFANQPEQCWDWVQVDPGTAHVETIASQYLDASDNLLLVAAVTADGAYSLESITFSGYTPAFLTILNPPEENFGTEELPYIAPVDITLYFDVFSLWGGGNVTDDPQTEWLLDPPTAGTLTIGEEFAALDIADDYREVFTVGATYAGEPTEPALIYFRGAEGTGGENQLPVAYVTADPVYAGPPPVTVEFDGRTSHDDDGTITTYRWDFNGDGTYDAEGTEQQPSHEYTAAGIYVARLEVEDDDGATGHMDVRITITDDSAGWHIITVREPVADEWSFCGQYNSLAVVDGMPAIAFSEYDIADDNEQLSFIRATDADGQAWGTPVEVDDVMWDTENCGIAVQLALVAGQPAVGYATYEYDYDDETWEYRLNYERALDASGTDWSADAAIADPTTGVSRGVHPQLADVGGVPGLCYYGYDDKHLLWTVGADADGSSFSAPVVLDTQAGDADVDSVGEYSSLALIDGKPAISYLARYSAVETGNQVRYLAATDAGGSSWDGPYVVKQDSQIGQGTALIPLADGSPAVFYSDVADNDDNLLTLAVGNLAGTEWTETAEVARAGYFNFIFSIRPLIYGGQPVCGYLMEEGSFLTTTKLNFTRSTDAGGNTWESAEEVADAGDGDRMDAAVVNGKPAMSYYHAETETLYFAIYY